MSRRAAKSNQELSALVRQLLESHFWLDGLSPRTLYRRLQDDHDGTARGWLKVGFTDDGDAWVETTGIASLRFRVPVIGGGMSQYTRTALLILAEAMRLDNETAPQLPRGPSDEREAAPSNQELIDWLYDHGSGQEDPSTRERLHEIARRLERSTLAVGGPPQAPARESGEAEDPRMAQVRSLMREAKGPLSDKKVQAVKLYREIHGCGLKEAVAACEAMR